MNLRDAFLATFRPPRPAAASAPWTAPAVDLPPLVGELWRLYVKARLPHFTEDEVRQLAVLLDPELRGILNDCIALLRRRPELGRPIELSADFLQGLVAMGLELDRLEPIIDDLVGSAETAVAALLAALGAWNARVLLCVQEIIGGDGLPAVERRRLFDLFRGALSEEERQEVVPGLAKRESRKAEALRQRVDAARDSQAVLGAMRTLRAVLRPEGDGQ